jgi:hypothetical protein
MPGPGMKINIEDLEPRICPTCKGNKYYPIYQLRRCSAIQSPVGKAGLIFIQLGFECTGCAAEVDLNEKPKEEKPKSHLVDGEE